MNILKNPDVRVLQPRPVPQCGVKEAASRRAPILCWFADKETYRLACRWIVPVERGDPAPPDTLDAPLHPRLAARISMIRRRAAR